MMSKNKIEMRSVFCNGADALEFAHENWIDLALLDIEMSGVDGLDLSDELQGLYPNIIIILISAYDGYVPETLKVKKWIISLWSNIQC